MNIWSLYLVALSIGLVTAQQEQLRRESNESAYLHTACSIELIWPPSDGFVLIATDSQSFTVYFKSWGNCSQFLHPAVTANGSTNTPRFHVAVVLDDYQAHRQSPLLKFELVPATPLDADITPVHYRLMRSPLLRKSKNNNVLYDSSGLDATKEFSIWSFILTYSSYMLNNMGVHDLDDTFMILEVHLISDVTTDVASVPLPSTVINFRLLGHPSSYFYQIPPRYTRFAIVTHFASFFDVFFQCTWLRVHERMRYSPSLHRHSAHHQRCLHFNFVA